MQTSQETRLLTLPRLTLHPEAWQGTQSSQSLQSGKSFVCVSFPALMCKWTLNTKLVILCYTCSNLHSVCWLPTTRLTAKHTILMQCPKFQVGLSRCPYKNPVATCMGAPSAHIHKARQTDDFSSMESVRCSSMNQHNLQFSNKKFIGMWWGDEWMWIEGQAMNMWGQHRCKAWTISWQIFTKCGYIHMEQLQLSNMFT